jgi:hypothetical protein
MRPACFAFVIAAPFWAWARVQVMGSPYSGPRQPATLIRDVDPWTALRCPTRNIPCRSPTRSRTPKTSACPNSCGLPLIVHCHNQTIGPGRVIGVANIGFGSNVEYSMLE